MEYIYAILKKNFSGCQIFLNEFSYQVTTLKQEDIMNDRRN